MQAFWWIVFNVWYYGFIFFLLAVPATLFCMKAYVVGRLFVAFVRVANRKGM